MRMPVFTSGSAMHRASLLFLLAAAGCSRREAPRSATVDTIPLRVVDSLSDATRAADVVRAYYAAIDARDYQRAYAAWAGDGPPGRPTLQAFAAGFAGTDSVQVVVGAPGRVEGAAGSRYVTVPVRVRAFEQGRGRREYVGSYTLRRSAVPGSTAADQRWHLYAAKLHDDMP